MNTPHMHTCTHALMHTDSSSNGSKKEECLQSPASSGTGTPPVRLSLRGMIRNGTDRNVQQSTVYTGGKPGLQPSCPTVGER